MSLYLREKDHYWQKYIWVGGTPTFFHPDNLKVLIEGT
jgi:coproporphyrinogen III oxidase-like Fe-S oxidoreductase